METKTAYSVGISASEPPVIDKVIAEAKKGLLPNSFQHPNYYVDWLAYYLTPEEEKVLNKAIREILGWRDKIDDRRARIALSIFVNGKIKKETGEQLCYGCGLSLDAVRRAIEALDRFGILCKEGTPTSEGQLYYLQTERDGIDFTGLIERRKQWENESQAKTEAARSKIQAKRQGVLSDNGGYCATVGVLSDSRGGGTVRQYPWGTVRQ